MTDQARPVTLATDPLAPYCIAPAWQVGNLLFLSGQASIGLDGSIVGAGDIDAQIAQTFANIERVLAAGGSDLSKVFQDFLKGITLEDVVKRQTAAKEGETAVHAQPMRMAAEKRAS